MAINKDRVVRIINGRAEPANQVLPPLMPGYDKDYKGYAFDPAKAKELLAEAGLKDGFYDDALHLQYRSAAAHRPGDPAGSGRHRRQGGDQGARQPERDRRRRHQGRGADDLVGRHGLDRRLPGSFRLLRTDPRLRQRRARRLELVVVLQSRTWKRALRPPTPCRCRPRQKERTETWSKIFTEIQEKDAPWIPVFNERRVVAKSKRMGGPDEIYIDPTRVIDYEAIFVKP